jgi:prolyl-tRNA editing enzyme YbaK/EbsC (Cys-tRNA(Pro) deacylase)
VELADSTRTSAEAAAALGTSIAQIAKSILFLAGDEPVLVLASGANRISVEKLAALVGRPVRRADADAVKRTTGFPIGGTAPVGHKVPVRVVIDSALLQLPEVWAAAGTPHAVFKATPQELVRLAGDGAVAEVRED